MRYYFRRLAERPDRHSRARGDAKRAATVATDALVRLEGATLWVVIEDDPQPMQRALKSLIAEARRFDA